MNGQCKDCGEPIEEERVARLAAKGKVAKYCEGCGARLLRNRRHNDARRERHAAMLSLGMQRVRGALGGVYYE